MAHKNKNYISIFFINFLKFILRILLFPFIIVYFFKGLKQKRKDKDKIAVFNMSQIDSLTGVEFENFLCKFFEKLGYSVKTTKKSHDYGADLLISKNGKLLVVQAKCYSKAVGVKAIQEIVAAKNHYLATDAVVATNNYFSKDAEVLALENNVRLIDRNVISQMIKKFDFKIEKAQSGFMASSEKARNEFNQRYGSMI